jgi:outer membrane lipoprotein LolB
MNFRIARQLAIVLPLLLAGCASMVPSVATTGDAQPATVSRSFQETIDLGGRLSVRYQSRNREETLHGSFVWSQTPTRTTVTLLSPLGQTMAIIDVSPRGATLAQGGQPVRSASNVDTLTAETLGWPLPVAGLREWLQGFAKDTHGRRHVATPVAPEVSTQDGWHIRYANWLDETAQQSRPKRIDLARATDQAGDVSIRIVIDTWQAH